MTEVEFIKSLSDKIKSGQNKQCMEVKMNNQNLKLRAFIEFNYAKAYRQAWQNLFLAFINNKEPAGHVCIQVGAGRIYTVTVTLQKLHSSFFTVEFRPKMSDFKLSLGEHINKIIANLSIEDNAKVTNVVDYMLSHDDYLYGNLQEELLKYLLRTFKCFNVALNTIDQMIVEDKKTFRHKYIIDSIENAFFAYKMQPHDITNALTNILSDVTLCDEKEYAKKDIATVLSKSGFFVDLTKYTQKTDNRIYFKSKENVHIVKYNNRLHYFDSKHDALVCIAFLKEVIK